MDERFRSTWRVLWAVVVAAVAAPGWAAEPSLFDDPWLDDQPEFLKVDEAFVQLDMAVAAREAWLPNLRFEPGLVHLRGDPRFTEVHRQMGLRRVDLVNPATTP